MDTEKLINQYIGKNVRAIRIQSGKTIEELAYDAGLNDKHVGKIERGEVGPSPHTIFKLAAGLNLKDPHFLYAEAIKEVYPLMSKKEEE